MKRLLLAVLLALLAAGGAGAAKSGKASGEIVVNGKPTPLRHAYVLQKNALLRIVLSDQPLDDQALASDQGLTDHPAASIAIQLDEKRQAEEVFFFHPELPGGLSVRELSSFLPGKAAKGSLAGKVQMNDPGFSFSYQATFDAPITKVEQTVEALPPGATKEEHALWRLKQLGIGFDEQNFRSRIMSGDADAVKLFLDAGMPFTAGGGLATAVDFKHVPVMKLLIAAGADVKEKGPYGQSLLMSATSTGDAQVVQALLDAGADPNVANEWHITPLAAVAEQGQLEMVQALLKAGADVNVRDTAGGTALSIAVMRGHVAIVRALLDAGADVERDRETLLEYAADKPEIEAMLRKVMK